MTELTGLFFIALSFELITVKLHFVFSYEGGGNVVAELAFILFFAETILLKLEAFSILLTFIVILNNIFIFFFVLICFWLIAKLAVWGINAFHEWRQGVVKSA